MQVRDNAIYYVEAWVKLPAGSTADPTGLYGARIFLPGFCQWLVVAWPERESLRVVGGQLDKGQWLSDQQPNRTETGNGEDLHPEYTKVRLGDAFLIDDLIITEVTDAKAALDAADTNAQALSSLSASVTQKQGRILRLRAARSRSCSRM